ncbi:hypothetical protein I4W88_25055 [Klebsiella pneumoniae]|uniref:hypothetical protein n=1 Tax=Klebsiella pneumoniae TaxID=573 RepID=UPI0018C917E4|nr:hypothetical protein [Klebsiella pneumoniae]MBG8540548.1 hypothetical protein [Klebsiella pneumoniae]
MEPVLAVIDVSNIRKVILLQVWMMTTSLRSERIKAFIDFAHAKQINFLTSALMFHNGRFYKRDNSVAAEITFEDMAIKM